MKYNSSDELEGMVGQLKFRKRMRNRE